MAIEATESPLPVFPLTGSLLLPGNYLPLNVFERRYRNMVRDVMSDDRMIGMVQPRIPGLDNWGIRPVEPEEPELYSVGCRGRIEQCERQADGRYHIVLKGIGRFRILRELESRRGYRRVAADLLEPETDAGTSAATIDRQPLLSATEGFCRLNDLEFDLDILAALPAMNLVNSLSAALPFSPVEKQTLLEAHTPRDRAELLLTFIGFDVESVAGDMPYPPPTIH